jgi:hypothetical protein
MFTVVYLDDIETWDPCEEDFATVRRLFPHGVPLTVESALMLDGHDVDLGFAYNQLLTIPEWYAFGEKALPYFAGQLLRVGQSQTLLPPETARRIGEVVNDKDYLRLADVMVGYRKWLERKFPQPNGFAENAEADYLNCLIHYLHSLARALATTGTHTNPPSPFALWARAADAGWTVQEQAAWVIRTIKERSKE